MGKITGFKEFARQTAEYRSVSQRIKDFGEIYPESFDEENLQKQGARCMDCGVPFCQSDNGCPVDNLIPEWNDLVYQGKWQEALLRLHKTNNFPEFTGRVCPAPCEGACVLGINTPAVTIKNIEQAIVDKGFEEGWISPNIKVKPSGKKVAIVGSGPAGLAAADELNKLGHSVTVFERSDRVGGLLMYGIPNMKLDKEIVRRRCDLLAKSGIKFITKTDIGKDLKIQQLSADFDAILLATGATKPRDLEVKNRDAKGIHLAMDYLTIATKNLLDGTKIPADLNAEGKNVVVIGGGDTGTDCIATSLRQGAKSITNFELMSQPPESRAANNPWPLWPLIHRIDYGHQEVAKVFGKDPRAYQLMTKSFIKNADQVSAIETINVEFQDGKLTEIQGSEKHWQADLILLSMGFLSPEHYLSDDAKITLDPRQNYQATYKIHQTSTPKIFAAGDCRRGQSLVVWAIKEGRLTASQINKFLQSK